MCGSMVRAPDFPVVLDSSGAHVPTNRTLTLMNLAHRALIAVSFGRWGWRFGDAPALELTTTGRRSGRPRSVMLTSPLQLGGDLVVVASRGGDDTHPAWYLNLEADPDVLVARDGAAPVPMRARVMTAEERAQHWPAVTEAMGVYARYQSRTDRVIPLVVLERVPREAAD